MATVLPFPSEEDETGGPPVCGSGTYHSAQDAGSWTLNPRQEVKKLHQEIS